MNTPLPIRAACGRQPASPLPNGHTEPAGNPRGAGEVLPAGELPALSLLVRSPGLEGSTFLLEDLLSGRQQSFDSRYDLLRAVADAMAQGGSAVRIPFPIPNEP